MSPSPNTANDLLRDTYYFARSPPWLLAAVFALAQVALMPAKIVGPSS
jgi:hypothetical protein